MAAPKSTEMRALREKAGVTQLQVAEFVSVAQSHVSQWETGSTPFNDDHAVLLAKLYGVSTSLIVNAAKSTRATWLANRDMRLADAIRARREGRGMVRAQVAEACDCTVGAVVLWEGGNSRPDRRRLIALAELFDERPSDLLADAGLDTAEIDDYLRDEHANVTPMASLLREGREEAGLTQMQVAAALGGAQASVSALEQGVHLPSEHALAVLASLYELDSTELMAARYLTRIEMGQVPSVTLPWPLSPLQVPRVRWFRQLRAHMGSSRSDLAEALSVATNVIADVERIEYPGLPVALRGGSALARVAALGSCDRVDLVSAYEPEAEGVLHLLDLEGRKLVETCRTVSELIKYLHFVGTTWTDIGAAAGVSRQSPINWASGSIPQRQKVVALADLLGPEVDEEAMKSLWGRSRNPVVIVGEHPSEPHPEPEPGTPDWIFSPDRFEANAGDPGRPGSA